MEQAETLDRLTTTIVNQVETMKEMVNTFSEYARTPVMSSEYVDLNVLIEEVVDLYKNVDQKRRLRSILRKICP